MTLVPSGHGLSHPVQAHYGEPGRRVTLRWPEPGRGRFRGLLLAACGLPVLGAAAFATVELADGPLTGGEVAMDDPVYGLLLLTAFLLLWLPAACVLLLWRVVRWWLDRANAFWLEGAVVYRREFHEKYGDSDRRFRYIALDDGHSDIALVHEVDPVGYHQAQLGAVVRIRVVASGRRAFRVKVLHQDPE
ncbi:hypothetical protein [Actinomadura craniellae]|uniref:hypothetical protein n=1 Tax=Actinomadura craniellae TaxID=2231787 RepID=UPI0011BFCF71|nr:hypothetical protein [Actinomadura craniellae]